MFVLKIGGAAGLDFDRVCADVAVLWAAGQRVVLVHGGSDETNRLAERLGIEQRFVTSASGQTSRLTDRETLELFMMATAAINRRLVERLQSLGANAIGLSGLDGRLIEARRKEAIRVVENGRTRIMRGDWTGTPERANTALLNTLLDAGFLPVVAPLGISAAGEALNVDADRAAALLAGALGADELLLLTNVPGLLRNYPDESSLIPRIGADEAYEYAEGRMKKKIMGAAEALAGGVGRVVIGDGRVERPVSAALAGAGTIIERAPALVGGLR